MSAAHHSNDVRSILAAIESEVGRLLHRGDIPHTAHLAIRRISQLNTAVQHLVHDTLPGLEQVIVKKLIRPSEAECCAFAIEIGLQSQDGSYFFMTKDGSGWKDVKNWKSVMHAWKFQKYFPSQKVVNAFGRPVERQPSIVQRDMAKLTREAYQ